MPPRRCFHGELGRSPAHSVDCDEGVPVLVCIDSNDRHDGSPPEDVNERFSTAEHEWARLSGAVEQAGSYQATPALSSAGPAGRHIGEKPPQAAKKRASPAGPSSGWY